ncbi:MAG: hypothetical protein U1D65_12895 [Pseudomonas sp.]|nr:hypothetical protein [Pseudomonas sp.]MDZ4192898.1 hypothetical protein [Pseudomonas sp.]
MKEEYTAIDMATAAADGFRAGQRAAQSAGVPDVSAMARVLSDRSADACNIDRTDNWAMYGQEYIEDVQAMLASAPTVEAEQVPTPEFVWVRLLEALSGDNGCAFTASTDDYREAKPALVQLIAAGFFRDDADSLDSDIWTVASGEQGEAAARFARCAEAYTVLSNVLNRVFERDDQAYDRNAERLTAEALGTGSGINMAATSIDELFDETAPPMPAEKVQCATCQDSGIVGHSDVCPECQDTWQPAPSLPAAGSEELTAVRCQCCANEYPHDSYDAGFIAGSGMCQVCDAAMPAKDLPAAGSAELIAEAERCLFVLREIGSMDADDITGDDVDLRFEDEEGCDTGCDVSIVDYAEKSAYVIEKMIAALSAQQSAPERVRVPVELLQDLHDLASDAVEHHRAAFAGYKLKRQGNMDHVVDKARALLASHAEGGKV